MRKSVQILITLIWLTGTIGVSMNKHFCKDELQQISFFTVSGTCNDMGTMPIEACSDETVHFVIDGDFNFEKYISEINIPVIRLNLIDKYAHITPVTLIKPNPKKENDFPLLDHDRIYKKIQSFLL